MHEPLNLLDQVRARMSGAAEKQQRYDQKIAGQLLRAQFGARARQIIELAGSEFSLDWYNDTVTDDFALVARKIRTPVDFKWIMVDKVKRSDYWKEYFIARQDYADHSHIGLVFDKHGDQVADMVMHNSSRLLPDGKSGDWYVTFWVDREDPFYIQSFKSFVAPFVTHHTRESL